MTAAAKLLRLSLASVLIVDAPIILTAVLFGLHYGIADTITAVIDFRQHHPELLLVSLATLVILIRRHRREP